MSRKVHWASRWGLIAAALGQAIGAGNIWRFPRKAAQWGGGSFILIYLLFNLIWAVPLLMSEMILGKKTGKGTVQAFSDFLDEKFSWMGAWLAWVTLGIGFEYAVVTSWILKYLVLSLEGVFTKPGVDTQAIWDNFMASPVEKLTYFFIVVILAFIVLYGGLKVFEWVAKLLVPSLMVLLGIVALVALTLPGVTKGLEYMFVPKWQYLTNSRTWLEALTQVAWSTGAGWGFLLTFAAYAKKKEDIALNAFTTVWGNMSASFLAATAIAVTVFTFLPVDKASEALGSGNSGLAFIYLTKLMANMPFSYLVSVFFFLAFFFAAFTSLIPMYEVSLTNFVDAGYSRNKIAIIIFIFAIFAGIPSALNISFQDSQDFVWGLGLWISGMFITYAIIKFGVDKAREYINEVSDIKIGKWYDFSIKYAIPILFVVLFGWWIWQSFQWYDFDFVKILSFDGTGYNLGTILVWWIFALMTAMLGSTAIVSRSKQQ